jgi:DNA polymerase-3 subunit gamma/tau
MDRGREPLTVLQNLAGFYRDLLIAKTSPNRSDLVAITPPTWKALGELARLWDIPTILAGQKHLKDSEVQIKHTTQPRLWLEVTLLGLLSANEKPSRDCPRGSAYGNRSFGVQPPSHPNTPVIPAAKETQPEQTDIAAPASQQSSAQTQTPEPLATPRVSGREYSLPEHSSPAPPGQPTPTPVSISTANPAHAALEPTAPDAGSDIWQQVIELIQPPATQALVNQQCRLLAFDGAVARISINSKPLLKLAQGKLPNIEAAFAKLLQKKVKVSLELATPTQTKTEKSVNEEPKQSPLPQSSPTTIAPPASSPPVSDPVKSHLPTTSSSQQPEQTKLQAEMTAGSQPQPPDPIVSELPKLGIETSAPTITADSESDEVESAAQRLAKAFNGEVVRLNLDPAFPHSATTLSLPSSLDDLHAIDTEEEAENDF